MERCFCVIAARFRPLSPRLNQGTVVRVQGTVISKHSKGVAAGLRPLVLVCVGTLGAPKGVRLSEWDMLMLLHPDDFIVVEAGNFRYQCKVKAFVKHVPHELPFTFVQSFHPPLFNTLL